MENTEKRALVTGASEGIGRALCLALAKEGYTVTGVARNKPRLESLKEELRAISTKPHEIEVRDLGNTGDVAMLAATLDKRGFDVFVNNAGFGVYGDLVESDFKKINEMIQLNCTSLVALSQAYMKSAKEGSALVNVASVAAFLPLAGNAVYAATKSFVHNLTLSLWWEGRRKKIYSCSVCPGYTDTLFAQRAGGDPDRAPRTMATTPEMVAASIVRALKKRSSPVIVPDFVNRVLVFLTRFLPQTWIVMLVHRMTKRAYGK